MGSTSAQLDGVELVPADVFAEVRQTRRSD
jgi:hypothetical protein